MGLRPNYRSIMRRSSAPPVGKVNKRILVLPVGLVMCVLMAVINVFTSYRYQPASTTKMVVVQLQQTSDAIAIDTAEILDANANANANAKVDEGDKNQPESQSPSESPSESPSQSSSQSSSQSQSQSQSQSESPSESPSESQTDMILVQQSNNKTETPPDKVKDANGAGGAAAAAGGAAPPETPNELVSCEVLMKENPHYADGAFLTRDTTTVVWKMRADKSRELTLPSTCRLKRYTADQAGMCLKHKNIFWVGDSLTRYQFTSFAYFLEHKKYPERFHALLHPCDDHIDENGKKTCSTPEEPNVAAEVDWVPYGSWKGYYLSLGGGRFNGTQMKNFRGRMEVASIRRDVSASKSESESKSKSDAAETEYEYPISDYLEYTTSTERYGDRSPGHVRVNSLFEGGSAGYEPMQGFNMTGCSYTGTCNYTEEQFEERERRAMAKDYDWDCTNIVDAFGPNCTDFQAMHPNPNNYMIYNRGIWGKVQLEKVEQMMASMYRMIGGDKGRNESKNRCFFKSTTGNANTEYLKEYESGPVRDATLEAGCEFLDVFHLTEEFAKIGRDHDEFVNVFWDDNHYTPWVYEELNNLLLNLLCNNAQSSL